MIVEAVFALVLWNGSGSARGDYFSKTDAISMHATQAECENAMLAYGREWEQQANEGLTRESVMSCEKVSRLKLTGAKPNSKPQSWGEWWRAN